MAQPSFRPTPLFFEKLVKAKAPLKQQKDKLVAKCNGIRLTYQVEGVKVELLSGDEALFEMQTGARALSGDSLTISNLDVRTTVQFS